MDREVIKLKCPSRVEEEDKFEYNQLTGSDISIEVYCTTSSGRKFGSQKNKYNTVNRCFKAERLCWELKKKATICEICKVS